MHLFFDTETTGLPRDYKAPASDLQNWPRMVQLAWLLMDDHGVEATAAEHIIRPDAFTIPPDAARIHGITTEIALRDGKALGAVLEQFEAAAQRASAFVAHNVSFDEKIVASELIRAGRVDLVSARPRKCTMKSATDYCGLPGRYGYKWPTLTELHMKLFGEPFAGAHNALADVRACARAYLELRRLGVMA